MCQPASADDYAELARYFRTGADTVRGELLQVVPWILGVVSGLLGLAVSNGGLLTEPQPAALVFAAAAFLLCGDFIADDPR